ncbi:MAG TPA: dienelactone hydrolase, partial [Planctomycetales bacterium]|nr:dienelactone hydrolase [Planctomycetales bacterium]
MRFGLSTLAVLIGANTSFAELKTEVIEYKHGDTTLEGYLAYDDAFAGKRPGVLVVHEWWGHNAYARKRAE